MYSLCLISTPECSTRWDDALLEQLISQMADGDKAALAEFYALTDSSIYGFALSILKHTYDAEDILQNTYLSIFSSAEHYKPMGKPMAWVLTITRNLCLAKLREGKKTEDIPQEDWEKYYSAREDMSFEDKLVLKACMEQLTPEEHQIVVLHAISGFKHREIAQLLSLPLATVLSKYNRALKKLRTFLSRGE